MRAIQFFDISIWRSSPTFIVDPREVGHDSNRISHSDFQAISLSLSSFPRNKIGLIICILTLWWHKRMCTKQKHNTCMCEKATIYCTFAVWFHTCMICLLANSDRLHAFVQILSSVWLYKSNIDQLLLRTKPALCPLYCTKSSLQTHIASHTPDPECTGSYATCWLDMSESLPFMCAVRTMGGVGSKPLNFRGCRPNGWKEIPTNRGEYCCQHHCKNRWITGSSNFLTEDSAERRREKLDRETK